MDDRGTPPMCECGTFAVGQCKDCSTFVCGGCSTMFDRRLCRSCHDVERLRMQDRILETSRRTDLAQGRAALPPEPDGDDYTRVASWLATWVLTQREPWTYPPEGVRAVLAERFDSFAPALADLDEDRLLAHCVLALDDVAPAYRPGAFRKGRWRITDALCLCTDGTWLVPKDWDLTSYGENSTAQSPRTWRRGEMTITAALRAVRAQPLW